MLMRSRRQWILAGVAVVTAMAVGGGLAQASSIGLKGHITPLPGGSPFLYSFELDLNNLSEGEITPGATLTVGIPTLMPNGMLSSGLVGVTGQSGTQEPPLTGATPTTTGSFPLEALSQPIRAIPRHSIRNQVLSGRFMTDRTTH